MFKKRTQYRAKRHLRGKTIVLVSEESKAMEILSRGSALEEARITGVILINRDAEGETVCQVPVVANMSNAAHYICREWVDEVFICPASLADLERPNAQEDLPEGSLTKLIAQCREMAVPVHIRLDISGVGENSFFENVNGFPVLTSMVYSPSPSQLFIKRLMDIIGGLIGSLLALVFILIFGPIIKKQSPGPILFRQERIGQNGKHFKAYKIRSMYMDAEERKKEYMELNRVPDGMMFKLDFDPRIIGNTILPDGTKKTGIGEFLRCHSIDEFPQFFNVLLNQMSIVGTRPPTVDEWERYQYRHRARLAFKPGVTGLWQVSGRSNITDFEEVVRLDTEYIEHWSIGLDLRIIAKTLKAVFSKDGAL